MIEGMSRALSVLVAPVTTMRALPSLPEALRVLALLSLAGILAASAFTACVGGAAQGGLLALADSVRLLINWALVAAFVWLTSGLLGRPRGGLALALRVAASVNLISVVAFILASLIRVAIKVTQGVYVPLTVPLLPSLASVAPQGTYLAVVLASITPTSAWFYVVLAMSLVGCYGISARAAVVAVVAYACIIAVAFAR